MTQRAEELLALEQKIACQFTEISWLELALTHPSINLHDATAANYERLEFLGDRVLGLVISTMLFDQFPDEDEGALARRHAGLVCGDTLVKVASGLELGRYVTLTKGEEEQGGRDNSSTLENVCEALIGAIYKDAGFAVATDFITRHWQALLQEVTSPPIDPKTALQEWAQRQGHSLPKYKEISREGPAHAPEFVIRVTVGDHSAEATATNKKHAEKKAAEALLGQIETD